MLYNTMPASTGGIRPARSQAEHRALAAKGRRRVRTWPPARWLFTEQLDAKIARAHRAQLKTNVRDPGGSKGRQVRRRAEGRRHGRIDLRVGSSDIDESEAGWLYGQRQTRRNHAARAEPLKPPSTAVTRGLQRRIHPGAADRQADLLEGEEAERPFSAAAVRPGRRPR